MGAHGTPHGRSEVVFSSHPFGTRHYPLAMGTEVERPRVDRAWYVCFSRLAERIVLDSSSTFSTVARQAPRNGADQKGQGSVADTLEGKANETQRVRLARGCRSSLPRPLSTAFLVHFPLAERTRPSPRQGDSHGQGRRSRSTEPTHFSRCPCLHAGLERQTSDCPAETALIGVVLQRSPRVKRGPEDLVGHAYSSYT